MGAMSSIAFALRLLAPLLLMLAPAAARAAVEPNHITPRLVAETTTPAPGTRITLAFAMKPDKDWHGYWRNPGDAGIETLVKWDAPKGLAFSPLEYPVPQTLMIVGIMNYVYETDYAHLVTLTCPGASPPAPSSRSRPSSIGSPAIRRCACPKPRR